MIVVLITEFMSLLLLLYLADDRAFPTINDDEVPSQYV